MSHDSIGPPREDDALRVRFETVCDATYAAVLRFVQRRVHPSHAEDVVADVFVVAWRRIADLPEDAEEARAWLFGIARRVLLAAHHGEQRRQALTVRIADDQVSRLQGAGSPGSAPDPLLAIEHVDLARAWRRLSPVHQESLALVAWDDLTSTQAAAVLGISPVAFRLRLSRARRVLRHHLGHPARTHAAPAATPARERSTS